MKFIGFPSATVCQIIHLCNFSGVEGGHSTYDDIDVDLMCNLERKERWENVCEQSEFEPCLSVVLEVIL